MGCLQGLTWGIEKKVSDMPEAQNDYTNLSVEKLQEAMNVLIDNSGECKILTSLELQTYPGQPFIFSF